MKKRENCFFGLHFDLHASPNTDVFGVDFDEKQLDNMMSVVLPDFVQCDTKGHPGYATFLTDYGNRTDIHSDILKKWRKITAKYGILLYAHYSGLFDSVASKVHPEWAAIDIFGNKTEMMSVFGDYADKKLIPQLKELSQKYSLDGAWIDGDCWCALADYSILAEKAYLKATGKKPPEVNKASFREFQDFCRQGFYKYVKHYITEVKRTSPNFEITSNWLNSSHCPDDINLTDFISGDLSPTNCVDSARFDGRVLADYERPWDIMSWGFSFYDHTKTVVQLCQEAACITCLGGGFQLYYMQGDRQTFRHDWYAPIIKNVAVFCRERQSFCHMAEPLHEAAVIFSREAFYHSFEDKEKIFVKTGAYNKAVQGALFAALDNQMSTEVVLSHSALSRDLSKYSLIIISDLSVIETKLKQLLLEYAKQGGALVLCGADTLNLFSDEIGVQILDTLDNSILQVGNGIEQSNVVGRRYAEITALENTDVLETMEKYVVVPSPHNEFSPKTPYEYNIPALVRKKYGNGTITAIAFDFGAAYYAERTKQLKEFFRRAASAANLKLKVTGSQYVDVCHMKKDGKEYIHLINTCGEHRAEKVKSFGEIPPIFNLFVEYSCVKKPKKITLVPQVKAVNFSYSSGIISFFVERLDIHTAAEIVLD